MSVLLRILRRSDVFRGYCIFILGVLLVIDTVYITWYAKRVKADPTKSDIIYGA